MLEPLAVLGFHPNRCVRAEAVDVGTQRLARRGLVQHHTPEGQHLLAGAGPEGDTVCDSRRLQWPQGARLVPVCIRKSELAARATQALADTIKGVADGKLAIINGFADSSGNPEMNAELAKQRTFAVRHVLKALGVADDKIELKKPEQITGSGDASHARRVEVSLM